MHVLVLFVLACGCARGAGEAVGGEWARYALETTVVVSDAGGGGGEASRRAELGYRLRGSLAVLATPDLLVFRLQDVELLLRGAAPAADYERRPSLWDARPDETFYATRPAGGGEPARLVHDPADPRDVLNYKRALASLFLHTSPHTGPPTERNETDVSGSCTVLYETVSADSFRKLKRRCQHDGRAAEVRRVTRYTLDARGALAAVLADEVVTVGVPAAPGAALPPAGAPPAVKARSLHTLAPAEPRPAPRAPPAPPAHYDRVSIQMPTDDAPDLDDRLSVEEALERDSAALEGEEAGGGGSAEGAAALARLVAVLRAAPRAQLEAMLRADRPLARLTALCRALGAAGAASGAAAVRGADLPAALLRAYLEGLALSAAPAPAAVEDALALATATPALAEPALLAVGAAAPRAADPALATRVRDHLTIALARCKEESCRRVRVAALGNMRSEETAETLVAHAAAAAPGHALAALGALRAAPALRPALLAPLAALARNHSRRLEERAAAMELVAEHETRGAALPLRTAAVWRDLHAQRAGELRRLLAQRVAALAERRVSARALLAALPAELRAWDAPQGTSTVLERAAGWAGGGWRAVLDSWQVARGGALRRGRVALAARAPDDGGADLLAVEVWTRGLAALAGDDAAEDDEAPAAGLALALAGVASAEVPLFDGQGELVGHIWAGTGSADTAVARGSWMAHERAGALPLAAGVVVAARSACALSAALDARAAVSLWRRTARAALTLRGAVAAHAAVRLAPAWQELRLEATATAAPRLHIHLDLDFYDGVALCVRAFTRPHTDTRRTEGVSRGGARGWAVRRGRAARVARAGRTLGLGRDNDVACRTLRDADEHDEDAE